MAYREKNGTFALRLSDGFFGLEVDDEQKGLEDCAEKDYPITSHFVVSFPINTDPEAAARAGRDWAEQMFDSDRLRDRFDYYTADHRDQAHLHTHVVVLRRGLDHEQWLKVSRRSLINYDSMRELQVEVAAAEGIILEAAPRLARGVHERPIPDARSRAEAEGRGPEASSPEHSEITVIAAAATILEFSRQIDRERELVDASPDIKAALKSISGALPEGHQIVARLDQFPEVIQELNDMSKPELKREAALLLPDYKDLRSFASTQGDDSYLGIRAEGGGQDADDIREAAKTEARLIAEAAGLGPDEMTARYGTHPVSRGLAERWRAAEMQQRDQGRHEAGESPESEEEARRAVDLARARINEAYRTAKRRLAGIGISFSEGEGPEDTARLVQ